MVRSSFKLESINLLRGGVIGSFQEPLNCSCFRDLLWGRLSVGNTIMTLRVKGSRYTKKIEVQSETSDIR